MTSQNWVELERGQLKKCVMENKKEEEEGSVESGKDKGDTYRNFELLILALLP